MKRKLSKLLINKISSNCVSIKCCCCSPPPFLSVVRKKKKHFRQFVPPHTKTKSRKSAQTDGRDWRTDGGKVRSLLRFVAAAFQLPRFINEKSTPGIWHWAPTNKAEINRNSSSSNGGSSSSDGNAASTAATATAAAAATVLTPFLLQHSVYPIFP